MVFIYLFRISPAAPYIPASFPSFASANFVSLHALNAYLLNAGSIYSNSISPAFDTPQPITNTSGLTTDATIASPFIFKSRKNDSIFKNHFIN